MSDPLTKQQEETKKLGSSTRTSAHSKFAMAKKWLVIIVAVLVPLAVFMNFGWQAITDFGFEDSRPAPTRQVTQAAPRVVQPAAVTPLAAPSRPETSPTQVAVPHCTEGMSAPVMVPAGWFVRTGWSARYLQAEYLHEGEWKTVVGTDVQESVEAFRYCATSHTYSDIGLMPLTWQAL